MTKIGLFDLEKHFSFYGAYHSNPANIFIHMLFVWPIFFFALVILHFTPAFFNLAPIGCEHCNLVLNCGFFFTVFHSVFFVCFDKISGSLAALLCFGCWLCASALGSQLGFSLAWKVVLAAELICFTGQFIGHGVFEKRAPAFFDNIAQASVMAPFFVLLEALHMAFGYEPCPEFHQRVKERVKNGKRRNKRKLLKSNLAF